MAQKEGRPQQELLRGREPPNRCMAPAAGSWLSPEQHAGRGGVRCRRRTKEAVAGQVEGGVGEAGPRGPGELWCGQSPEGGFSLIPKESLGGGGLPLARSGVESLFRWGKGRKEGTD